MTGPEARSAPSRHPFGVAALLAVLLVLPPGVAGQDFETAGCSYDTCALRVEPGGFFSGAKVVRGVDGTEVAGYGRSSALEELFAVQDSARHHYEAFVRHDRAASRLGWVGIAVYTAGAFVHLHSGGDHEGWALGLQLGGFGMMLTATFPERRARRAFSNAVWWYNRSLTPP